MLDSALRLTLIAGLLAAGAAHAQNLVAAPDFDTANEFTSNWGNLGADKTWSPLDFESNAFSGSVSINNTASIAGTGTLVNSTCFPVLEGDRIAYSAWQFTPSPPQAEGFARIVLQWRASCPAGAFVGGDVNTTSEAVGEWTYFSNDAIAPVGAGGARLALNSVKITAGGSYQVYFDHVYAPEPRAVASACAVALCLASAATARRVRPANARDVARVALRPAR
jgi:hypothetical protein